MSRRLLRGVALCLVLAIAGCSYPLRNDAIVAGQRPVYDWEALSKGELQDTLVIFTASGGGTRATALAMSVLQAMEKVRLASGSSLADEIDIMSSVSGDGVTRLLRSTAAVADPEDFIRRTGSPRCRPKSQSG